VLQLSGGPDWLDWDRFDLEAKADAPASDADLRVMLQTMLADRFYMKVHCERQEMRVFALMVARNGPNLEEWKEGQPMPTRSPK
jgi:uncharacterized protein (TIGR03435 family)